MPQNNTNMGRPYSGEAQRSVTVRLRMEPAEAERLDQLAAQLGTTRSGAIREGLRRLWEQIRPDRK